MTRSLHHRLHTRPDGRALHLYGWEPSTAAPAEDLPPAPSPESHRRWHALRREWVIYAAHRQDRTFQPPPEYCPLCPADAGRVPGEIPFEHFEVAVFDNRFPGFAPATSMAAGVVPEGLPVAAKAAHGRCEVVVYTSDHQASLETLSQERRELLVRVWGERHRALMADPAVAHVMAFENRGAEVGVTLHHPHGQIYAMPFVSPAVSRMVEAQRGESVVQSLIDRCLPRYAVAERDTVAALVPPFARFPYEVWIAPRRRVPHAGALTDDEVRDFADLLGDVVARYDRLFDRPFPYILTLYAAPRGAEDFFHFHAEFFPPLRTATKLKYLAGIEQGAGTFLVDALPETTAERLREVI